MPLSAPVDSDGSQLYYKDTGALEGNYLTIVMTHGAGIHTGIYGRILPLAAANRLRIVTVNRRDYPGSTPLSDEDLASLASAEEEVRGEFFRQRAFEFGEFLAWFVQKEKIPPYTVSADGKAEGGVVLLSWSAGTTSVLGLLAFADRVPIVTQQILEPYFRALCIWDSPCWALGVADPEGFPNPLRDTTLSIPERFAAFQTWVSGYYAHPDITSHDPATLTQQRLPHPPASLDAMTPEEKDGITQHDATGRSETLTVSMTRSTYLKQTERALDKSTGSVWPRCKVKLLWCEQSLWEMVCGAWGVEKLYAQKRKEQGDAGRILESIRVPEANHFLHWDQPEKACQLFAAAL